MCYCTPEIRTPFCGKPGCEWPKRMEEAPEGPSEREVWPVLLQMLEARVRVGEERYGTRLKAGNGRDALKDAWEEAADLLMYLTQMMMEREAVNQ